MFSKKRSRNEIFVDILEVAKNGAKKSHIVYRANLNFEIVKDYLNALRNSDLIEFAESRQQVFRTTEKGTEYIKHFNAFKEYMN